MGSQRRRQSREKTKSGALRYLPHAFALLAVAAALAHFRTQIDSNDEGIAAMGAWRILRGEVPYRDFHTIVTPLSFYAVAPFYALFGVSFTVGRVVTQLLGIAMVVSVFRLARRWIPSPLFAALPLAFLCQAGVGIFPFASHHWFADVFCLAALVAASRALANEEAATVAASLLKVPATGRSNPLRRWELTRRRDRPGEAANSSHENSRELLVSGRFPRIPSTSSRPPWEAAGWWLAGAAGALAFESLQDQGLFFLIGLGIVAALAPPAGSRRRSLARFGGGALAAGLPLALVVLSRSGWAPGWHDLVWFPLTAYRATPGNDYGFFQPFGELLAQWTSGAWRHAPVFTASATVTSLALIATPLAAPLLVLWAWRRRKGSTAAAALLLVGAGAFLLTALHRWAPINLQWAAAPPALALAWWLHHEHEASPKGRLLTSVAAGVLLTAFGLFGMGRIGQAANGALWFDLESPAGRTRVPGRATGQRIQEMITTVGQRVPKGESLLVYGWPNWAFATLHPCPVRWDGFAPPDFPPGAYGHDAIAEVEEKKVAWIVTPVFDPPAAGQQDEWKDYLVGRYRLEWANPSWGLWRRSGG